jgi:hypothetical protein
VLPDRSLTNSVGQDGTRVDQRIHVEIVSPPQGPKQMMDVGSDAPAPGALIVENLGVKGYAQTVAVTFNHRSSIARQEFSSMHLR